MSPRKVSKKEEYRGIHHYWQLQLKSTGKKAGSHSFAQRRTYASELSHLRGEEAGDIYLPTLISYLSRDSQKESDSWLFWLATWAAKWALITKEN